MSEPVLQRFEGGDAKSLVDDHFKHAHRNRLRARVIVPVIFRSLDGRVALERVDGNRSELPRDDFVRWTNNLRTPQQMVRVVMKNSFRGGRKTPVDNDTVRPLGIASVREAYGASTMILPFGALIRADSTDERLVGAITPDGFKITIEWVPLPTAPFAVNGANSRLGAVSDAQLLQHPTLHLPLAN